MADALIQQSSFPDLIGWEDSVQKVANATAAVAALRAYLDAQQQRSPAKERRAKQGNGPQGSMPRSGRAKKI
jgi:hypothetical protein